MLILSGKTNCPIREHTGDGYFVGRCEFYCPEGICPRHGVIADYPNLDDRDVPVYQRRRKVRISKIGKYAHEYQCDCHVGVVCLCSPPFPMNKKLARELIDKGVLCL